MNKLFAISILFLVSIFQANGQKDFNKSLIQIGRSGYFFGDNPFKIGKSGVFFTNHGIRIHTYAPYIAYERRLTKLFGLRAIFEQFEATYCNRTHCLAPGKIEFRDFYQVGLNGIFYLHSSKSFNLSTMLIFPFRFGGFESQIETIIDHGTWQEVFARGDKIQGLGIGAGIETRYNFYKKLNIAIKSEYLRFGGNPKSQLGITGSLGYEF